MTELSTSSPNKNWQAILAFLMHLVLFAMVLTLNSSKAVLSVGWISLIGLSVIYRVLDRSLWKTLSQSIWVPALLLMGLWALATLTGIGVEDVDLWKRDIRTKMPFLWLPLAIWLMPPLSSRQLRWLSLGFIASQAFWAILTLINLARDYEAQMLRVQQNGNIDVPGSISHIYFGVLLAFAVLLGLYLLLHQRRQFPTWGRWLIGGAALLCFITLHILNSRTAQVSLYAGLAVFIAAEVVERKAFRAGVLALVMLLSTPVAAYFTVPSFRVRVQVTIWDFQQSEQGGGNLADNSLSTRRVGWRAAWEVGKANPIVGVGLEDLRAEMVKRYEEWGLELPDPIPTRLKVPHNLYLKYWAGAGIPGVLLLLGLLLFPLFVRKKPYPSLLYGFLALMGIGFCFENILERQIGIIFFILTYLYLLPRKGQDGNDPVTGQINEK